MASIAVTPDPKTRRIAGPGGIPTIIAGIASAAAAVAGPSIMATCASWHWP